MIQAVNLRKTYYQGKTRIEALKDASLAIAPKEAVLITGPSGAGKSTFLHLLGGLDTPSAGRLFFDGTDFYGLSDKARSRVRNEKIGFIFQFYHLLPEFTVLENVMLPAIMKRPDRKESRRDTGKRIEKILKLVGLEKRMHHRPAQLSGGEAQRVAIARSLVNSPRILLCDEPTGNLDSKIGQEIVDCLWVLKEERNMALVVVTHHEHMHDGFDKRYKIKDGRIEELKDAPQGLPEWQVCRGE
jgi:lipoprotein-releasing system ATP-binding protein